MFGESGMGGALLNMALLSGGTTLRSKLVSTGSRGIEARWIEARGTEARGTEAMGD